MKHKCFKGSREREELRKTTTATTKYILGNDREKHQKWSKTPSVSVSEKVNKDGGLRVGSNLKEHHFLMRGQDTARLTKDRRDTTQHPIKYTQPLTRNAPLGTVGSAGMFVLRIHPAPTFHLLMTDWLSLSIHCCLTNGHTYEAKNLLR